MCAHLLRYFSLFLEDRSLVRFVLDWDIVVRFVLDWDIGVGFVLDWDIVVRFVLDWDIVVSVFELKSPSYVLFWTNTQGKSTKPNHCYRPATMVLALNNLPRFICHLTIFHFPFLLQFISRTKHVFPFTPNIFRRHSISCVTSICVTPIWVTFISEWSFVIIESFLPLSLGRSSVDIFSIIIHTHTHTHTQTQFPNYKYSLF